MGVAHPQMFPRCDKSKIFHPLQRKTGLSARTNEQYDCSDVLNYRNTFKAHSLLSKSVKGKISAIRSETFSNSHALESIYCIFTGCKITNYM